MREGSFEACMPVHRAPCQEESGAAINQVITGASAGLVSSDKPLLPLREPIVTLVSAARLW